MFDDEAFGGRAEVELFVDYGDFERWEFLIAEGGAENCQFFVIKFREYFGPRGEGADHVENLFCAVV